MKGIKWERWWIWMVCVRQWGIAQGGRGYRIIGTGIRVSVFVSAGCLQLHVSVCLEQHLKTSTEQQKKEWKKNIEISCKRLYIMEAAKRKSSVFREKNV